MKLFKKKEEKKPISREEADAIAHQVANIPKPQTEDIDPRALLGHHLNLMIELARLEKEYQYLKTEAEYKASKLKDQIENVEQEMKNKQFTNTQIEENREWAFRKLSEAFD